MFDRVPWYHLTMFTCGLVVVVRGVQTHDVIWILAGAAIIVWTVAGYRQENR